MKNAKNTTPKNAFTLPTKKNMETLIGNNPTFAVPKTILALAAIQTHAYYA